MKKGIFLLFTLIACALVLANCTQSDGYMRKLQEVDSLMEPHPQAAYDSLCLYGKEVEREKSQKTSMRYRLLMAKAQNKLFLAMPSDSAFQEVVDYYESKGTSNDKMAAHYLMGCIYRDQKEAPRAIQSYQVAQEWADTLNPKCDYVLLSRIYAQMEELYAAQNLFEEAVRTSVLFGKYALKGNDTLSYFRAKELLIPLYLCMGDTAKSIAQTKLCSRMYQRYGMPHKAAGVYPLLIHILVKKYDYKNARRYMFMYERQSGLFDKNGNIERGRELYYATKGQYFIGINNLDSAEYYYEKLKKANTQFYVAYSGLLLVATRRGDVGEIMKYAALSVKATDEFLQDNRTNAILQSTSLYNYQRIQKALFQKDKAVLQAEKKLLILGLLLLVICSSLYFFYKKYRQRIKQKQKELEIISDKYLLLSNQLDDVKLERDEKIDNLRHELQVLQKKHKNILRSEKMLRLDDNNIYQRFKQMAIPALGHHVPTDSDWNELECIFAENYPLFYQKLRNRYDSFVLEFRVCILVRLRFTSSEIVILLNSSKASVSNAKSKANEKLFGEKGASTLYFNMLNKAN